MNADRRSTLRLLSAAGLAGISPLCSRAAAPAASAKPAAVAWPGGNHYERSVRSYNVPDVTLIDSDAKPVRLRDALASDEPVMLNFVFTTCSTICPVMVRVFADVPSRLGTAAKEVRLVSISIDPENDTPAKLNAYAKTFGEGLRWRFLTGRLDDIKTVQTAFDTYRGDKMNHEPLTLIRRARGKSWLRIDGFANPDDLAREYARVSTE